MGYYYRSTRSSRYSMNSRSSSISSRHGETDDDLFYSDKVHVTGSDDFSNMNNNDNDGDSINFTPGFSKGLNTIALPSYGEREREKEKEKEKEKERGLEHMGNRLLGNLKLGNLRKKKTSNDGNNMK